MKQQHQRPNPPKLVITDGNGAKYTITGRVARMILWLCENEAQIEEIARGRLDVGFSGEYQEWHLSRTIAGY